MSLTRYMPPLTAKLRLTLTLTRTLPLTLSRYMPPLTAKLLKMHKQDAGARPKPLTLTLALTPEPEPESGPNLALTGLTPEPNQARTRTRVSEYERSAVQHSAEHHAVNARGGLSSPGLLEQAKSGAGLSSPGQLLQARARAPATPTHPLSTPFETPLRGSPSPYSTHSSMIARV
jgi:hypothetical protein